MMVSDFDDRRLRDLEEHLAVDDAVFVDAFRSRNSLMDNAPQQHAELRVLRGCLVWTAAAVMAASG